MSHSFAVGPRAWIKTPQVVPRSLKNAARFEWLAINWMMNQNRYLENSWGKHYWKSIRISTGIVMGSYGGFLRLPGIL